MPGRLQAETPGKGVISIDLEKCEGCESKACAGSCPSKLFEIVEGFPKISDHVKKACTDCLACELSCQAEGNGGLRIVYPMPDFDEYLKELEREGILVAWRRKEWPS